MFSNKVAKAVGKVTKKVEPTLPVDLDKICEEFNLKVKVFTDSNLQEYSGIIDYSKGIIYINGNDSPRTQRLTLAHELGHYLLHYEDGKVRYTYRDNGFSY